MNHFARMELEFLVEILLNFDTFINTHLWHMLSWSIAIPYGFIPWGKANFFFIYSRIFCKNGVSISTRSSSSIFGWNLMFIMINTHRRHLLLWSLWWNPYPVCTLHRLCSIAELTWPLACKTDRLGILLVSHGWVCQSGKENSQDLKSMNR